MNDQIDQVKSLAAAHLEQSHRSEPGKLSAVNWKNALNRLDDALSTYLPVIGPLAPPQVAALANLIAEAVKLADQAANSTAPQ